MTSYTAEDFHYSILLSPSRCRGAVTRCIKSSLGCSFQGPRSALQSHLWECPYRDQNAGKKPVTEGEVSTIEVQRKEGENLGIGVVGGCDTPLEQSASIIVNSPSRVQFILPAQALPGAQTPDIIRSAPLSTVNMLRLLATIEKPVSPLCYTCKEKIVTINKDPSETLGISIAGGMTSHRGDTPVYITNINPDGCVGRTNVLKKGDVLVSINSTSLLNLTHLESVKQIRQSSEVKVLTLRVIDCRETSQGDHNFTPSWIYWLQMPQMLIMVRTITLLRSPSGSLGFSIVGGVDCSHGNLPIIVKSVVPDTPAAKDGRLRCGDILLAVNEHNLRTVNQAAAVEILKHIDGAVTLSVVSWPGTVV
ncbi:E3 ubiquitin-protein ligase LNX [Bulinus truncatus]|nr:E3 ubiquitin-protein ligase LNX [Bulinus truncatus]